MDNLKYQYFYYEIKLLKYYQYNNYYFPKIDEFFHYQLIIFFQ